MSCPTTRTHPRTMAQAFGGKDAAYACAIERHRRWHAAGDVVAGIGLAVMLAVTLVAWWSS